ncbi:hypothetical protein DH2020_040175 [Rehmannia glutinosa]|uniref:Uncharacterized protein n=1 Tax=Rehmannia glutinosa TaxID=99300 RepID=A0ABR0UUU8_REHGL
MNALNPLAAKPSGHRHWPLNPHRPSFSKPLSSLSFRITPPPPLHHVSHSPVKASSQNSNPKHPNKPRNFPKFQINTSENSNSIPIKATVITTIATAAFFLSGFCFSSRPSIAEPMSPPPTVDTTASDSVTDEEKGKSVEQHEIDELKNLVEIKIKSKNIPEAISILDRLTQLEPDEIEWRLLRAHLYAHNGEFESARKVFDEMLNKDPCCLEACQGLVNVDSQQESSNEELKNTERKIEEAIRLCKENGNSNTDLRDFKMLLAQIQVLEGKYDDALKFYQELEKEEPRDFRPYLCQGLIYTLLSRKSDAEINFEKYRRLVPEGHPYESYFDDNMMATKIYAQKVENERDLKKNLKN